MTPDAPGSANLELSPEQKAERRSSAAARVMARADQLASYSAMADGIERCYLTPQHARVNAIAGGWMREAGMETWQDEAANRCGRRRRDGAPASENPAHDRTVLLGSHLDSVPDAGRYDGILGVLVAIEVADRLRETKLPFALEVVAFGDEEGTRFGATLLGSRAISGGWDPAWLELRDANGVTLASAAEAFGIDPAEIGRAARPAGSILAYLEAHIEQGPHLEDADQALGVVTSIAAAERRSITFVGEARHVATPWHLRHDALQGAAEAVLACERIARESGAWATVGRIAVEPGAVNVVPGLATFSLDLRAATAEQRDTAWSRIHAELESIAAARELHLRVESLHRAAEVVCDPGLREAVAAGIRATGEQAPPALLSIAGHDAMAIEAMCPVGMLFVRCKGGISHHRDESVREDDVALSIDALEAAVLELAERLG